MEGPLHDKEAVV